MSATRSKHCFTPTPCPRHFPVSFIGRIVGQDELTSCEVRFLTGDSCFAGSEFQTPRP